MIRGASRSTCSRSCTSSSRSFPGVATRNDHYLALAYAVRDRLLHRWVHSARTFLQRKHRTVIYLSAEYLLGPQLGDNFMNLGIEARGAGGDGRARRSSSTS